MSRTCRLSPTAVVAIAFGLAFAGAARSARAETLTCTAITSLPYVITVQGIYCLTGDLATAIGTGHAIEVATNNVVIDLNGHKLGGLSAGSATETNGIYANQRQNVTIKNGTIRGFYRGIFFDDSSPFTASQGHVVEDVRVDQNTFVGISARGRGSLLRNNQVVATGGTSANGVASNVYGIFVTGQGTRVLDNDVIGVTGVGTGSGAGIRFQGADDNLAISNRVSEADTGISFTNGGAGKYSDNLTTSVTTPFTGGTSAGNNN